MILAVVALCFSMLSACSDSDAPLDNFEPVVQEYYRAWQSRDAETLWALLSKPSKERFDEAARRKDLDSGKLLLEEMFSDPAAAEISSRLEGSKPVIIRTRMFYGLAQCLVRYHYKKQKTREVLTLRPEAGKWKIIFEFTESVSAIHDDELLLVLQPKDRGKYDAEILGQIWQIKDEEARKEHVKKIRGASLTITGKASGAGGGLGLDSYLLMEVTTPDGQTGSVMVHFDQYYGTGHKFHFEGDLLVEIKPAFGKPSVRIKKGQSITITGLIALYPPTYGYLSISGAFLQE